MQSLQSLIETVIVVLELATVMESATTVVNKWSVPSDAVEVVSVTVNEKNSTCTSTYFHNNNIQLLHTPSLNIMIYYYPRSEYTY